MFNFLCFLMGLVLGSCVTFTVMCMLQINRISEYEAEISKLKSQLDEDNGRIR